MSTITGINLAALATCANGMRVITDPLMLTMDHEGCCWGYSFSTLESVAVPLKEFRYSPSQTTIVLGSEERPLRIEINHAQAVTRLYLPLHWDYMPIYRAILALWLSKRSATYTMLLNGLLRMPYWKEWLNTGLVWTRLFWSNPTAKYMDLYHNGSLGFNPEYQFRSKAEKLLYLFLKQKIVIDSQDYAQVLSLLFDYDSDLTTGLVPILAPYFPPYSQKKLILSDCWNFSQTEFQQIKAALLSPAFRAHLLDLANPPLTTKGLAELMQNIKNGHSIGCYVLNLLSTLAYQPEPLFCLYTAPVLELLLASTKSTLSRLFFETYRNEMKMLLPFMGDLYFRRRAAERITIFIGWLVALLEAKYHELFRPRIYDKLAEERWYLWERALTIPDLEEAPYLLTLLGLLIAQDMPKEPLPGTNDSSKFAPLWSRIKHALMQVYSQQSSVEDKLASLRRCFKKAEHLQPAALAILGLIQNQTGGSHA